VAPSLNGGTPFRSPGPHTLPWEGSANHFSEACPANGINPRAKLRYSSLQASLIELAEPSYYSNGSWIPSTSALPAKAKK
jgi:hypothetical protein